MYSTADFEKDKAAEALRLGASSFFIKTSSFTELVNYLKRFAENNDFKLNSA